jgi:Ca2+-transporting ATPase
MMKWYGKTSTKVVETLNSDISLGLNENKIKYMRETYGDNSILKPKIPSILSLIIDEVKQLWILVYLSFIVMLHYNGLHIVAYIVTFTAIISVALLVKVDYKEEKSLMAIDNLNTSFSYVVRSGKVCKLSCEEMVVGDIVLLEKGGYVPADIRIIECEGLKVKEVAVTGEKYEVEKYPIMIEGEVINLSEIKNIVFKSSVVTQGEGLGIVIATGMDTQIGKIIKVLLEHKNSNMGFSKGLTKALNKVSLITVTGGIITLIFSLYKKFNLHEIINALIYICMTFNLPIFIIILSLFFNILFVQFKKKNIHIKNVSVIYFLSNISTIFMKKLGSISENKLIFREVYCNNVLIDVQNECLEIEETIERIMSIALLCNDAELSKDGNMYIENTNSMEDLAEHTILKFCREEFIEISEIESKQERIFQIPYDSDKRIKTVVTKIEDRYRANVTGVLDKLISKCTHILINGVEKEIKDSDIQNIINIHIGMSNKAYYVVGFGYRNFNYEPSIDENIESNLVFVGLIGFENPTKERSYETIKICKDINVRVIIDEEDNKLAAFAFGKKIGLVHKKEEILSGIEIDHMSKEEFDKNIENVSIFSKITPKHKSDIVNSLNCKEHCIASVGDTLTDLEYLNNSHISISVGNECSTIVKKLSSLFLKGNDFSEIINLVQLSKRIINFISGLVLFLITAGLSEIFIILINLIVEGKMPFELIELLYLNFIIIPTCGLSILLQNRDTKQTVSNIDYKYIRRVSIKSSFIASVIYFSIFTFIDKLAIPNLLHISLIIFAVYENIFSLTLLSERGFLKNKTSYLLIFLNLLLQSIFILYLIR